MGLACVVLCGDHRSFSLYDDFTLLRLIMKRIIGFFVLLLIFSANLSAQCAMCRATAEQASQENSGIAEGLNMGIVYLMGIPYLLFLIGGLVFFRKRIFAFFQK